MPIENYERKARITEQKLFEDAGIPENTKRILQRFLIAYDVSSARKIIFLQKIKPLLLEFDPIEFALTERDQVNRFFAGLRGRYSPATYATYLSVIRRFLLWLNNKKDPASMVDIKPIKKSDLKRKLKPADMLTWEDGQLICDALPDIQMQAAVQVQLDCGFRPSEFIDLTYQDVKVHTGLAVFEVQDGKTGARTVVANRCVPALLKWMEFHPTKRPSDPLWVLPSSIGRRSLNGLEIESYPYPAIKKRIKNAAIKAGINKPMDFYNFRHSSCVLDKMDNLPVDLASERHGHSVKHFSVTYGRLSIQDTMRRFHSHYGTAEAEPVKKRQHQACPVCQTLNEERLDWCGSCGTPLNTRGAQETAIKSGLLNQKGEDPEHEELERLRAELAASKEREKSIMQEQMAMLQQMQQIRSALAVNTNPYE